MLVVDALGSRGAALLAAYLLVGIGQLARRWSASILLALYHLPSVAFATGGVVNAVAQSKSRHLVAPGDYVAFADATLEALGRGDVMRASCGEFAQGFVWSEFGAAWVELLQLVSERAEASAR